MKILRNLLVLFVAILGFSLVEVNAQNYSSNNAKEVRNIEQKVFRKILFLPYYGAFDHISYKVEGNTVTLYGRVADGRNKSDAANAIKRIEGVANVVNNIEILPPSPFDNQIRFQIARSFARDGASLYRYIQEPRPSIRIIVDGGNVTLEGFVNNRSDSQLANILANGAPGVFSVTNNLIVGKERVP